MAKTHVAVLRGGPDVLYDYSLKTGQHIMQALSEELFEVRDILIDKDRQWYRFGKPTTPTHALQDVDVVFNTLYGPWGEGGELQKILDLQGVPYVGSGVFASAMAMDKWQSKQIAGVRLKGVAKVPPAMVLYPDRIYDLEAELKKIFKAFPPPYIIKPQRSGASVGVTIVRQLPDLLPAAEERLKAGEPIVVEVFIRGKEITVGVLEAFRGKELYDLPATEVRLPDPHRHFSHELKMGTKDGVAVDIRCPATVSEEVKRRLARAARIMHHELGLSHYSRSDFIVTDKDEIYFLEINSHPGMTKDALLPMAAEEIGLSFDDLVVHLLDVARFGSSDLSKDPEESSYPVGAHAYA